MCVCVYVRVYIYIYIYTHTHTHTHVSDSVEIVCELPLLPSNSVSETILHKQGRVGSVVTTMLVGQLA